MVFSDLFNYSFIYLALKWKMAVAHFLIFIISFFIWKIPVEITVPNTIWTSTISWMSFMLTKRDLYSYHDGLSKRNYNFWIKVLELIYNCPWTLLYTFLMSLNEKLWKRKRDYYSNFGEVSRTWIKDHGPCLGYVHLGTQQDLFAA